MEVEEIQRPNFEQPTILAWLKHVRATVSERLKQHGPSIYASPHETLGIITEEYHELIDAVQLNDRGALTRELIDIAVAAILGLASSTAIAKAQKAKDID